MTKIVVFLWFIAFFAGVIFEFKQTGMIISLISTAILVSFNTETDYEK